MSPQFWQAIASTSWWVIPITAFIIYVVYQSLKPKVVPVNALTVMPILFCLMTLVGIVVYVKVDAYNLMLFIDLFLLGAGIGWLNYRFLNIKAITDQHALYIPGSIAILVLGSIIGSCQYYLGLSANLTMILNIMHNSTILMSIFGFFSGFFIGRIGYIIHVLKSGPFMTAPAH